MAKFIRSLVFLAVMAAIIPAAAFAEGRAFRVRPDGGSRISFVSDAPLETITGVTSQASGEITFDPAAVASTRGQIQVETAKLRTGNDLRDEHLRGENWLDSRRYPNATFEITRVQGPASLRPNRPTDVRVTGRFTLHGVTKEITAKAKVTHVPLTPDMQQAPGITGDVLRIQSSFDIQLTDYNVSVPAIVRLKVANQIKVEVSLRGIAEAAGAQPAQGAAGRTPAAQPTQPQGGNRPAQPQTTKQGAPAAPAKQPTKTAPAAPAKQPTKQAQ